MKYHNCKWMLRKDYSYHGYRFVLQSSPTSFLHSSTHGIIHMLMLLVIKSHLTMDAMEHMNDRYSCLLHPNIVISLAKHLHASYCYIKLF